MLANLTTREVQDADWDAVAELMNAHDHHGFTGDFLRERQAKWTDCDPRSRLVVLNNEGKVIAYVRTARRSSEPAGKFQLHIYVDPAWEAHGIARRLLEHAESFAKDHEGTQLSAAVSDISDRGNDFAKSAGFYVVQHLFESRLALDSFDPSPFEELKASLETAGYTFFSLDEVGNTEENWHRLHELDSESDKDTPGYENWGRLPFERYVEGIRDMSGFSPAGVHLAGWNGEWVAMNIVKPHPTAGQMQTDYSGVLRSHRGKGLAQVVKMLGIEHCRRLGAKALITNNDERNAAMLAVNAKFGFGVQPGFRMYQKDL